MKLQTTALSEYLCPIIKFKAIYQIYIACRIRVFPSRRAVPEEQGHSKRKAVIPPATHKAAPMPSQEFSVDCGQRAESNGVGHGCQGRPPGMTQMPEEKERIHTKEGNYLRRCRGEKEIFFSRSWYLWYSVLVFGRMESPLPFNY